MSIRLVSTNRTSRWGRAMVLLLLAGIAVPAAATLRTIEQAYELTRSQVSLPTAPQGGLTIRLCSTCPPVILQVTAATAWFSYPGEQRPAGQEAVLAAFAAAGSNPDLFVYVYYEPQTLRVKRIVLDVPSGAAP
jgi:hypothetical protein